MNTRSFIQVLVPKVFLIGLIMAPTLSPAAPVHRWSFNNPAGPADTGAMSPDLIAGAGAEAVVLGDGATFTGTGVHLPGGGSGVAAYIDLPNNLISPLSECTLEGWVTIDSQSNAWTRFFDFGDSLGAELFGPGGGGEGRDYLALTPARGTNYGQQRLEFRNFTDGAAIATFDTDIPTVFGQQIHFVVTVQPTANPGESLINYWRDNVQRTTDGVAGITLAELNDVNCWLGRSNWTGDNNTAGTFDEFRIYDNALTADQVASSFLTGPTSIPADSDGDGMLDAYEIANGLNPAVNDAAGDLDADGVTNLLEAQAGTKPNNPDSDGDTVQDGAETSTGTWVSLTNRGTKPLNPDSDEDGVPDGLELNTGVFASPADPGTNPNLRDTDGDTFGDASETAGGSNPVLVSSVPELQLTNRYSFSETSGRQVADSIGGARGTICGEGFEWQAGELMLPGGSGDSAAYVDLPNRLISTHALTRGGRGMVTLEGRATVLSSAFNWSRILDFGSNQPDGGAVGEIAGPGNLNGAGVEGRDYILISAVTGTDPNRRQASWRNQDPAGGGPAAEFFREFSHATFNSEFHFVLTIDESSGRFRYYENGSEVVDGAAETTLKFHQLNDVNNWLGRSNWTGDANLNGSFNEFRIYSGAMTAAQAAANTASGPDSLAGLPAAPTADADSDGMKDWFERANSPVLNPAVNDAAGDPDADTLTNVQEFAQGTNPNDPDSDDDGLSDGAEVAAGTDPRRYDSDGDHASDGAEVASGANPLDPGVGIAPLAHRWSFNEPAGAVSDGASSPDVLAPADAARFAFVRGEGASFTGSGIQITGGASTVAPYVDLPNGVLSSRTAVTLEAWNTIDGTGNSWGRIVDIGSTSGPTRELAGPGGGGDGLDYFMLSACRGTDYNVQRLEWRNEDPAGGGIVTYDSAVATTLGEPIHTVLTVESIAPGRAVMNYWRNGVRQNSYAGAHFPLSSLNDVNVWLGRSNWVGDANAAATFDEFRIYSGTLNDAAVEANFAAGPDSPPSGVPANFTITNVSRDAGTGAVTLTWNSEPGKTYTIQQSTGLVTWPDVPGAPVPSGGATTTTAVTPPAGTTAIHYRVKRN